MLYLANSKEIKSKKGRDGRKKLISHYHYKTGRKSCIINPV